MGKLILLGVVIVVLVVAGAIGVSMMGGGEQGGEAAVAEAAPEVPLAPAVPVVYELAPLSVPMVEDDRVQRYLAVVARYELLARPDQAQSAEEHRPLLRDAIIRNVHEDPVHLTPEGDDFDRDDLQRRFLAAAQEVFAKGIVQTVLVADAKAGLPAPPAPPAHEPSGGAH